LALAIEEKYDQVRQLIAMGKERGYLLYDEVNDILPAEVHSSEEIDDLLSTFERNGIDIYEDLAAAKAARAGADSTAPEAPEAIVHRRPRWKFHAATDATDNLNNSAQRDTRPQGRSSSRRCGRSTLTRERLACARSHIGRHCTPWEQQHARSTSPTLTRPRSFRHDVWGACNSCGHAVGRGTAPPRVTLSPLPG